VLSFATLLAAAPRVHAQALEATCEITFSGSSGLGPWTGRIPPLRVRPAPAAAGRWSALVEIPIESLEDGNKPRDAQLHAMFESRRWPTLRAEMRDVDPVEVEKSQKLTVDLTIRDQKRRLEATVSRWHVLGPRTEFEADVAVSLEEFSLEAPSVLGLSKVADDVRIHARVAVMPAASRK
jgi:polyisoprenoid-binding protein YceI